MRIFEFVLANPRPSYHKIGFTIREKPCFSHWVTENHRKAVTAVNSQFRVESKPIFYSFPQLHIYVGPLLELLDERPYNGDPHKPENVLHSYFRAGRRQLSEFLEHVGMASSRKIASVEVYLGNCKTYDERCVAFLIHWLSYDLARIVEMFKNSSTKVFAYFPRIIYGQRYDVHCMYAESLEVSDMAAAREKIELLIEGECKSTGSYGNDEAGLALCRERLQDFVESIHRQCC